MILGVNSDYSLNRINQTIFIIVKCAYLFEVRTELLNVV
jgi:hypothetical protein